MNEYLSVLKSQPFRALFPLGYICLFFGLGIWTVNLLGASPEAARAHAILLGNGFLFAFSLGILLTEIPALLRTPSMGLARLFLLFLTLVLMGIAALSENIFYAQVFHLLSVLNVSLFLGASLLRSGTRGHPGPALALCASLVSVIGSVLFLLSEAFAIPREFGRWGLLGGFQGYFLLFAIACVLWSGENPYGKAPKSGGLFLSASLALLLASLALEAIAPYSPEPGHWFRGAYLLRAAWLAWAMIRPKGVFSMMSDLPMHGFLVRVGLVFLLGGTLLSAIFPGRTVLFNHAAYLAGFTLIALAAASGVVATGLQSAGRKAGLRTVGLGALALLGALGFRIAAGYAAESRALLLGVAATLALAPLFAWAVIFFPGLADPDDRKGAEAPEEPLGTPLGNAQENAR